MSGSQLLVKLAPQPDCLLFDSHSAPEDGLATTDEDIGSGEVVQTLVVAFVVIVIDERAQTCFQLTPRLTNRQKLEVRKHRKSGR
jgi:hypothetical protein